MQKSETTNFRWNKYKEIRPWLNTGIAIIAIITLFQILLKHLGYKNKKLPKPKNIKFKKFNDKAMRPIRTTTTLVGLFN